MVERSQPQRRRETCRSVENGSLLRPLQQAGIIGMAPATPWMVGSRSARLPRRTCVLKQNHAARMTVSKRIAEPLTLDTVIGARQAASQQLRAFFVQVIGHRFSYDIHMRTFLASDRTKTLGEAVDHWYASRGSLKPETLPQLEFVRFTKAWHISNPNSSQVECRAAWKLHRSLPVDQRPPID
jgi:Domain of unknown function (DUF6434)